MGAEDRSELENQARLLKSRGEFAQALALRLKLREHLKETCAEVRSQTGNLNWIAYLGVQCGNLQLAEQAARRCLELYEPIAQEHDEKLATYLAMLSSVLAEQRKFDDAIIYLERAIVIYLQNRNEDGDIVKCCGRRDRSSGDLFFLLPNSVDEANALNDIRKQRTSVERSPV